MMSMFVTGRLQLAIMPVAVVITSCVMFAGCGSEPAGVVSAAQSGKSLATEAPALAKIVFVDQKECCNCTRERIDATWKALTDAVGEPSVVPVERIHSDTQPELAAEYTTFKPIMVMPALYFIGADGSVLEMLQGELRTVQIIDVLTRLSGK